MSEPTAGPHPLLPHPLLLIAPGRCGTTLATRLLSRHPLILTTEVYPYEGRAAQFFAQLYPFLLQPTAAQVSGVTAFYEGRYSGWRAFLPADAEDHAGRWVEEQLGPRLRAFLREQIRDYYSALALGYKAETPRYVLEKTPIGFPSLGVLEDWMPGTRLIVMMRDLRDTLCSIMAFDRKRQMHGFGLTDDLADAIHQLGETGREYMQFCERRGDQVLLLRYEDLVTRPLTELERCLTWLELEQDEPLRARMLTEGATLDETAREHMTSDTPAASIGRWQQDLSPDEKALCWQQMGDSLQFFGYGAAGEADAV